MYTILYDVQFGAIRNTEKIYKAIKKDSYLYLFPESKKYFYKKKLEILKNPEFANTLRIISNERSKGFYEGKIAKNIVYTIQNSPIKKGVMNLNDLKKYYKSYPN